MERQRCARRSGVGRNTDNMYRGFRTVNGVIRPAYKVHELWRYRCANRYG